jgi:aryl-alcohol dehydrogenase-like predicted oxidoreductase
LKKIIISKNIFLRDLRISDINHNYFSWFEDNSIKNIIKKNSYRNIEDLKKYFRNQILNKVIFLGIFVKKSKKNFLHIGNIKFENINYKKNYATLGILIGKKEFRNIGIGQEIITKACNWIYNKKNIYLVNLRFSKKNFIAHKVYKKCGFIIKKIEKNDIIMERNYFINKITIGTANFVNNYNLIKPSCGIKLKNARSIIKYSSLIGINSYDTAPYYNSENILGRLTKFETTTYTKISFDKNLNFKKKIINSINNSLRLLKKKKLDGVLFHNEKDLLMKNRKEIWNLILSLKKKGLIKKIGVSFYNPKYLIKIVKNFDLDFVQVPVNLFDKRFLDNRIISLLNKKNIEIHARSVFLQGLLLNTKIISKKFLKWRSNFNKLNNFLKQKKISNLEACTNFVLQNKNLDKVIFGVNSVDHLMQIIKSINLKNINFNKLKSPKDLKLINPSLW